MEIIEGWFLGKDNAGFIVWNEKQLKRLQSKDFKEAIVESKLTIKNVKENVKQNNKINHGGRQFY